MSLGDIRQLVNAVGFATHVETPVTVMASIRFDLMAGFEWSRWLDLQADLFDRLGKRMARVGIPLAYAWVREIGREGAPHTHVLLHLPHKHWTPFRRYLIEAGAFRMGEGGDEPMNLSGGDYGAHTAKMRAGLMRYVLKTCPPDTHMRADDGRLRPVAKALGLRLCQHHPDSIPGRHVGVSRTLDRAARAAAGWRELRGDLDLRRALHP